MGGFCLLGRGGGTWVGMDLCGCVCWGGYVASGLMFYTLSTSHIGKF